MGQSNQNHKPKKTKGRRQEKTSCLANKTEKKGNQFINKLLKNTIVVDLTRKKRKGGRIPDPTPPEIRRSSILLINKITFPKNNNL